MRNSIALVKGIACKLMYVAWDYPGAQQHAWLQVSVLEKLQRVDLAIRRRTGGTGRLLIWDALRSLQTQTYLYERETARLSQLLAGLAPAEIRARVDDIVRPPSIDLPPPHTTGGAVDVTIFTDGSDTILGTFDDFSDYGRPDYFDKFPPVDAQSRRVKELRDILRDEMLREDFTGIPSEFWHFEYGTRYWSQPRGAQTLFDDILEAPPVSAVALGPPLTPVRQPIVALGVAHAFPTSETRAKSLRGEFDGFYYARTRHPTERQTANMLGALLGGFDCVLFPTGLSAVISAVWAMMSPGLKIVVDQTAYYESRNGLRALSDQCGWKIVPADLSCPVSIREAVTPGTSVVFCDHPRNWLLTTPHLALLREVTRSVGAALIVDTSLRRARWGVVSNQLRG
jgi:zinc D-Ala-D-Ala dipeptidase